MNNCSERMLHPQFRPDNLPDEEIINTNSVEGLIIAQEHDRRFFNKKRWDKARYIQIGVMCVLVLIILLLPLLDRVARNALNKLNKEMHQNSVCSDRCSFSLVESIPEGLIFPEQYPKYPSTYETWMNLIDKAESTIEIGSFYWTMRGVDVIPHPSAKEGEDVFEALLDAGTRRKINIKITQSQPSRVSPDNDTEYLMQKDAAVVRSVNFDKLLGAGVLHTKLWIVDEKHFYVGSANMDWRALTQVKEMGIVGYNCSCLAKDLRKIFKVYWELGIPESSIPDHWNSNLNTEINQENPIKITSDRNDTIFAYISSSPAPLSPEGRTDDINAILDVILTAKKFVYISVMDYIPLTLYTKETKFWPLIDNAIRTAAINNKVDVKMLISRWNHSRPAETNFLESLAVLSKSLPHVSIEIKRFVVPSTPDQDKIPFSRVNHNKYMVTDTVAYIGTSNWSADYFINTAGVGVVISDANATISVTKQLRDIFERDWNSNYSIPLK